MLNYSTSQIAIDLVGILKALSQPTRLRILDMLMEGVQCSCEISEQLGLAPNLVSYHMRALEEAGLVTSERDATDARWIYYSVRPETLAALRDRLGALLDPARIQPRQPNCGPQSCGDPKSGPGQRCSGSPEQGAPCCGGKT
jgi:ArsR family transcriptional regulator